MEKPFLIIRCFTNPTLPWSCRFVEEQLYIIKSYFRLPVICRNVDGTAGLLGKISLLEAQDTFKLFLQLRLTKYLVGKKMSTMCNKVLVTISYIYIYIKTNSNLFYL